MHRIRRVALWLMLLPWWVGTPVTAAGAATKLAIVTGNNQTVTAGTAVPGVLCVVATDAQDNVVSGVVVTWMNVTGGGSVTGATQSTFSNGIATLGGWTLGPTPGVNTVTATAPGLNSLIFTATGLPAAGADNVVIQWNASLLTAIQNSKMPAPLAARAIAMVHTAIFDAWAAYDDAAIGTQLGGTLRRPLDERNAANKMTAMSFAAYRVAIDLLPAEQLTFDNRMIALGLDPQNTSTDPATPIGVGNTVSAALLAFRHADGSNQLGDLNPGAYSDYTSYAPVNSSGSLNDASRWQPLMVAGQAQQFLTPHWGLVKAFAIGTKAERAKLMPKACALNPSRAFARQAADLLSVSGKLNDLQKSIASYWDDGDGTVTPAGHWCQFAQFVSGRDRHSQDDDVKLFFALGNALLDASVAAWDSKRGYDSARPVSAIRYLYANSNVMAWGGPGLGTQTIPGAAWQSYLPTPASAEYASAHSVFSAAGAQILTASTRNSRFGMSVTVPFHSSPIEPAVPDQNIQLSWRTYSNAVSEAGLSRRYGGVNFKNSDTQGRALGKKIGVLVWKKAQTYFLGTAK